MFYYRAPEAYAEVMRFSIALNASFFNTHRMLSQYKANAYYPKSLIKKAQEVWIDTWRIVAVARPGSAS